MWNYELIKKPLEVKWRPCAASSPRGSTFTVERIGTDLFGSGNRALRFNSKIESTSLGGQGVKLANYYLGSQYFQENYYENRLVAKSALDLHTSERIIGCKICIPDILIFVF